MTFRSIERPMPVPPEEAISDSRPAVERPPLQTRAATINQVVRILKGDLPTVELDEHEASWAAIRTVVNEMVDALVDDSLETRLTRGERKAQQKTWRALTHLNLLHGLDEQATLAIQPNAPRAEDAGTRRKPTAN